MSYRFGLFYRCQQHFTRRLLASLLNILNGRPMNPEFEHCWLRHLHKLRSEGRFKAGLKVYMQQRDTWLEQWWLALSGGTSNEAPNQRLVAEVRREHGTVDFESLWLQASTFLLWAVRVFGQWAPRVPVCILVFSAPCSGARCSASRSVAKLAKMQCSHLAVATAYA